MQNLLVFLLSFLTSAAAFSQPADQKTTAPTAQENSLLWKISGKGMSTSSYLFGTIHLIDKDDFFLSDSARAFINRSKLVTFEINMDDMTDLGSQFALLGKAMMHGDTTLSDLLTKEEYKLVQDHFEKMGLPLFFFERMKPMFLSVFASGDMSPDAMSSGEMVSYEMEILDLAKKQKSSIGGLETAEFQMSVFDSIPYRAQAQMLVQTIQAGDTGDEEFDKMVELYKNQDIQGMMQMMGGDEQGIAKYEDLLLTTRNKNWIPVMGEMMKKQPTFFAVGAGHLGGENGVVSLLRKEGYTVVPVK
ncbi:MAG: TraB/GumN family protein [Bacteroidota bacterium]